MTEKQADAVSKIQEASPLTETDVLLKGLDSLSEFYGLGLDKGPLSEQLRTLEEEALHYATVLKRVRTREEAIREMVQELRDLDGIVEKYQRDESALIQILLEVQAKNHWLPKHALMWISERLNVPMAQILHIATFYKAFSLKPRGKHMVRVCLGTACHVRGGPRIIESAERALRIKAGKTTEDMRFSLESVNCLGCCALGPLMVVDEDYHGKIAPSKVEKILSRYT
jgi:NADH-quinone oxidoreductase subunit E